MEHEYNVKKYLGFRIREERVRKSLSIEKLSELIDISPSFLASVERGEKTLSIENLYKVSNILEVTIDSLIKKSLSVDARNEAFSLLLSDLEDSQFNSVFDIVRTVIGHIKPQK